MSTIKELIQDILKEAAMDAPSALHAQAQQFNQDFVDYIKHAENGIRKGFDVKTGRWLPHASVEGGTPTIAYGHKLQPGETYKQGITEEQALRLLNQDLEIARMKAAREVDAQYGQGIFRMLPLQSQEMLTDFVFNLGSLRSFPKFTRAVLKKDYVTMNNEYKRFSGGRELAARNQAFHNRYLGSRIAANTFTPKGNTPPS